MKRWIVMMLLAVLLFGVAFPASAKDSALTLHVNDRMMATDTSLSIQDGRTMVPLRFLSLGLGADTIGWDGDRQEATIRFGDDWLRVRAGGSTWLWNDQESAFSRPLPMEGGRLLVPVAELRDRLAFSIRYDARRHEVHIHKEEVLPDQAQVAQALDDTTWLWLARIADVEAQGQPYENKLAVANVVLNRTEDDRFPDTVEDVLFQVDVHVQFPPAHRDGFRERVPSDESMRAAKAALLGSNNIEECLFFNNRPFSGMSDRLYRVLNGEYFYR